MDDALRRLQAAARGGDRHATLQFLHALRRTGAVTREAELIAYLLEPDGGALGPAALLPRTATAPGTPFEPSSSVLATKHALELTWRDPLRGSVWAQLDSGFAGSPREELRAVFETTLQLGVRHLVLDLRQVPGLTSSGFNEFIRLKQRLEAKAGSLRSLLSERVRVISEMLDLTAHLGFVEDPQAACAELDRAPPLPPVEQGSQRWLHGILRWGTARAQQAALCLAAHNSESPEVRAAFESSCAVPRGVANLPALSGLAQRAQAFWTCAERLHDTGCWPVPANTSLGDDVEPTPELNRDEFETLLTEWVPRLI